MDLLCSPATVKVKIQTVTIQLNFLCVLQNPFHTSWETSLPAGRSNVHTHTHIEVFAKNVFLKQMFYNSANSMCMYPGKMNYQPSAWHSLYSPQLFLRAACSFLKLLWGSLRFSSLLRDCTEVADEGGEAVPPSSTPWIFFFFSYS